MSNVRRSLRHAVPSLHGLVLFEASARHLNFSKAAEELSITQSAVSHGVRQPEAALGHPLFLRENRALKLSPQGQRLFATVSRSFGSIAEIIDDMNSAEQKTTLVVGASTVLATEWLLPRAPSLRRTLPDLKLELRCLDHDPELMASGIDLQLRRGDGAWDGYEAIALFPVQIVAVCSTDYLRRNGPIASPTELLRHRLISYVDSLRFRIGWTEWLRAQGVAVTSRLQFLLQVNDSLVALGAAEAGEGVALGWRPIVDRALRDGRLVMALPNTLLTGRRHYILTVAAALRWRVIKQFCDWLIDQINLG